MVGVQGLEPWASCSQSRRATNCATPRYSIKPHYIIAFWGGFVKHFSLWSKLWVGFKNVQILEKQKPANPCAARLCGVSPHPIPDTTTALPNQARYQLRYTRIVNFCHYTTTGGKIKVFSVCGHLCGQSRFYGVFDNRRKSRKHRCHKALRRFTLPRPDTATALPNQARYQLRYTQILLILE